VSGEEREAMRRSFLETPIGAAQNFSTFEEGWKACHRYLLDEEHEVWTCMTCGLITEGQSCSECGCEAMPGRWERAA
jgi:rubrerythrin